MLNKVLLKYKWKKELGEKGGGRVGFGGVVRG